jgi:SAM-dependent methyltransferase
MRLNVCSGRHVLKDWVNVDVVPSTHQKAKGKVPEILADMRSIPLPDACADELMCIHGLEHVYPWEADVALAEWHRLLKPSGLLVLEMPDLLKCCANVLSGYTVEGKHKDQYGLWGLYGNTDDRDPFMCHKFAYSPASLTAKLKAAGFVDIKQEPPQWHAGGAVQRDMRMTARRA